MTEKYYVFREWRNPPDNGFDMISFETIAELEAWLIKEYPEEGSLRCETGGETLVIISGHRLEPREKETKVVKSLVFGREGDRPKWR